MCTLAMISSPDATVSVLQPSSYRAFPLSRSGLVTGLHSACIASITVLPVFHPTPGPEVFPVETFFQQEKHLYFIPASGPGDAGLYRHRRAF